jgi:hypothetical protein
MGEGLLKNEFKWFFFLNFLWIKFFLILFFSILKKVIRPFQNYKKEWVFFIPVEKILSTTRDCGIFPKKKEKPKNRGVFLATSSTTHRVISRSTLKIGGVQHFS